MKITDVIVGFLILGAGIAGVLGFFYVVSQLTISPEQGTKKNYELMVGICGKNNIKEDYQDLGASWHFKCKDWNKVK